MSKSGLLLGGDTVTAETPILIERPQQQRSKKCQSGLLIMYVVVCRIVCKKHLMTDEKRTSSKSWCDGWMEMERKTLWRLFCFLRILETAKSWLQD